MTVMDVDRYWMQAALDEATHAVEHGDVPVGAVVVHNNKIVGSGHNRREVDRNPIAHAEIIAMQQAAQHLGDWRLTDSTLYCTLEPCVMCAGAMVQARLGRLVWAADDPKAGAGGSIMNLLDYPTISHHVTIHRGILADEAALQLKMFFDSLR